MQAIRLRPDFDRACYNLGTVFYAFACSQQSSITQRLPSSLTKVRGLSCRLLPRSIVYAGHQRKLDIEITCLAVVIVGWSGHERGTRCLLYLWY